ncbi:hypothetical protein DFQ30_001132 [Apophysomyces sp. BC1015]|nr:hypothetical protein DFQ30_001132 [Apophysomyces sp. BC1015]
MLARHDASSSLRKALGPLDLTFLGIGAIIGTGIFVLTGTGAVIAGPALTLSFVIAAIACCFAALAYAEFSSTIPVAGSIYTYSYATLGELAAWIIGWDLMLEYGLATSAVSVGWSGYLQSLLAGFGISLPQVLTAAPGSVPGHQTWFNLPAFMVMMAVTFLLSIGVRESTRVNNLMVAIKVAVVLLVIAVGAFHVRPANWHPFMPMGWSGVFGASAVMFFAFIGFDSVSSAAEEVKNPKRDLPIGIIASLAVCAALPESFLRYAADHHLAGRPLLRADRRAGAAGRAGRADQYRYAGGVFDGIDCRADPAQDPSGAAARIPMPGRAGRAPACGRVMRVPDGASAVHDMGRLHCLASAGPGRVLRLFTAICEARVESRARPGASRRNVEPGRPHRRYRQWYALDRGCVGDAQAASVALGRAGPVVHGDRVRTVIRASAQPAVDVFVTPIRLGGWMFACEQLRADGDVRIGSLFVLRNWLAGFVYAPLLTVMRVVGALPFLLGWLVVIPLLFLSVYVAYRDVFIAR